MAEVERAGYNSCSLQIQCQNYDYRVFSTFSYCRGPWNAQLTHQYWPELTDESCRSTLRRLCRYSSHPDQRLFAATFGYRFADKYKLSVGIENLLDEDPPCVGAEPNRRRYCRTPATHASHIGRRDQ